MTEQVVAFGGGVNSTAMLIGLHDRGEKVNAILFADTGGERIETYEYINYISNWCKNNGFPEIITVTAPNKNLETDCLDRKALPSIAYGFKTCSLRWKKQPQDKWLNNNGLKNATRLVGIDADESHRAKPFAGTRYPLIEWGYGRDECIDIIKKKGLLPAAKSSCFFCPSSKKYEILELKKTHPLLFKRAIAMEKNAQLESIKGLGRSYSWEDLALADEAQMKIFNAEIDLPCDCMD